MTTVVSQSPTRITDPTTKRNMIVKKVTTSSESRWFQNSRMFLFVALFVFCSNYVILLSKACTNIIVTPGASYKGSMMLAYSADSHTSMGQLYHYPPVKVETNGTSNDTEMIDIYEWDTGKYFGQIPQSTTDTYNVVGNCNEHNVCIGETSWGGGGPSILTKDGFHNDAIIDYGSLIYITLQRSQTSKEAIQVMTDLVHNYGYRSLGETFSIVDPNDAYIIEMQSKGLYDKGAIWVSCRVPDGTIVAHANHARITNEFLTNNNDCTYSNDIIDFAIQVGIFDNNTTDIMNAFSFSDIYNPVPAYTLRYSDARVWDIYRAFVSKDDIDEFDNKYLPRAMGTNNDYKSEEALPLWLTPFQQKVTLDDIRKRMSSHYENTPLDYTKDVASGIFEMPYRPRPNNWLHKDSKGEKVEMYVNERPVAVEKTGFNFIAEIRPLITNESSDQDTNNKYGVVHKRLQTIYWYAQDDCSTSPRIPQYPSSIKLSKHYDTGLGPQRGETVPIMKMDYDKSFWIQNLVSNLAYFRWKDIYPILQKKLNGIQYSFEDRVRHMDHTIEDMIHEHYKKRRLSEVDDDSQNENDHGNNDDDDELDRMIINKLTDFSIQVGNEMHYEWLNYWGYLFVRYRDLINMSVNNSDRGCGCDANEIGLSHEWQTRIIKERPDHWDVYMDLQNDQSEMTVAALQKYQNQHPAAMYKNKEQDKEVKETDSSTIPTMVLLDKGNSVNKGASKLVEEEIEYLRHSSSHGTNNNKDDTKNHSSSTSSSWMMNMFSSASDHPLLNTVFSLFHQND